MTELRPHGMDFSETGEYPAVVEVVLGNGYRYKTAASDEEARKVIKHLADWTIADDLARHERGES